MSFIADVITDFITDVMTNILIVRLVRKQRSYCSAVVLGILVTVVSFGAVMYMWAPAPISVNDYQATKISYSDVRLDPEVGDREITFTGDRRENTISSGVWSGHSDPAEIVQQLSRSNSAVIWHDSPESTSIKGIETEHFSISPEYGAAWDNANRRAGYNLAWFFLCLGLFLLFAGAGGTWYENRKIVRSR